MRHGAKRLPHFRFRHARRSVHGRARALSLGRGEREARGVGAISLEEQGLSRLYERRAQVFAQARHRAGRSRQGWLHGGIHRREARARAGGARRSRARGAHQGSGPRRRRCKPDIAFGLVRHLDRGRRRCARGGDVSRVSPLDGRLLRRLSRAPRRRDPRRHARRASGPRGDQALRKRAVGVGGDGVRALRRAARSSEPRASMGRGAGARSCGRPAHLHRDAALCARRPRHMGEPLAAALSGASMVRHAQHGIAHRRRRDGSLSEAARRDARSRARLAAVLDRPARRACRDDQDGLAGAEAEAQRIRDQRALFPEH